VQIVQATLRTISAEAVRDELVDRNVAALVRGPSLQRLEVAPWSADAAGVPVQRQATGCTPCSRWGVLVGLRRGELLGLRWVDVDLNEGVLRVRQTVQRLQGAGLVFGPPKTGRSQRTIPLPGPSIRSLREHQRGQALERAAAGGGWRESGLVFTTRTGTVIEPRNLSRLFEELMGKSGVRRIRFHDLRHTCASLLLAQGVPARVVMDVLGHSQLSITTDLYSHVMPSALRDASDAMERALSGPR
jgi:integrase